MLLGAHVSIAGGVQNAPQNGVALGCDVIQIFSKNQRQWKSRPYTEDEIRGFRENYKSSKLRGVVVHGSYLMNLAAGDPALWKRSKDAFLDEVYRCDQLGIPDFVFHPGAHVERGAEWGVERIASGLREALDATHGSGVHLDLECMAGQGTTIGNRFEDLGRIIDLCGRDARLGLCLDTCHLYAAGFDLATAGGYEATMKHVDRLVGLKRVRAFHLNDSKRELGSHVDRHENIGKGHIGLEGFRLLLRDDRFAQVPMNLETPGGDDGYRADLKNLRALRALAKPARA